MYDPKCEELARFFLTLGPSPLPDADVLAPDLAREIQDTIEQFLGARVWDPPAATKKYVRFKSGRSGR